MLLCSVADPGGGGGGGGSKGSKDPPSARPVMNKLTYELHMIDSFKNEAFNE